MIQFVSLLTPVRPDFDTLGTAFPQPTTLQERRHGLSGTDVRNIGNTSPTLWEPHVQNSPENPTSRGPGEQP
jgi:hypothetical protein